jgi:phosphohistidine phosphatase
VILWLVRHAKTGPGDDDHRRILTSRGRHDADALGRRLGVGGDLLGLPAECRPRYVLCSDALRTVQTAERLTARMTPPPPVEARRALYGASPQRVLEEIGRVDDSVDAVMVVGHNPTIHALAAALAGTEVAAFPTAAAAVYRCPGPRWRDLGQGELLGIFSPPY